MPQLSARAALRIEALCPALRSPAAIGAAPRPHGQLVRGSSGGTNLRGLRRCLHSSRPARDDDVPGHRHPAFKLSARSDFVLEHNQNNEQRHRADAPQALRAARRLRVGDLVHRFHAGVPLAAEPSHWTLQVGPAEHINLAHHVLRNVNHACEPNVRMRGLALEACRDIAKEEELTLDYNCSEHELRGGVFHCACGAPGCVGEVRGWAHLDEAQRAARRERCQPWLLSLPSSGDAAHDA